MKAKRITGIILAICLLFTMIPMAAAEGAGSTGVTEVSDHDELQAVLDAGGTAKLVQDIEGGVTVTRETVIDLNGFVLNGGIDIPRNSRGSLTLKDSDPTSTHDSMTYTDPTDGVTVYEIKGGVVTGRISVNAKGQFFMEAGTLTGSGGIFVDNGTAVMSGGTIAGITGGAGEFEEEDGTWASGGVVFVSGAKGSFTMEDGLITCNAGRKKYDFDHYFYGDVGVCVNEGTFTMENGSITKNIYANGGGVAIREDGVFNMLGGEISWNQAQNGGGVYVDYGTFNMSGGSIAYNNASSGGGIMTSGWHFGWSVPIVDGVPHVTFPIKKYVNITGGSITGNRALDGGGILLICPTHLEISDASVTDNIAETQGGGIRIGRVNLTLNGNKEGTYSYPINGTHEIELQNCVISGNTAGENGGGMWVPPLENQEKITVDWPDYSGDVFFPQTIFNVYDNVVISGNTSEGNGGIKPDDLYLAGETLITAAGDMTGTTIGVTSEKAPTREEPVLLTKNLSEFGNAKNFFSDDDMYSIGLNDEGEALLGIFFADLTFEVIWYDKDGNMVYPSADVNCMLQVSADKGETWTPVQTILGTNGNTYIVRDNTYDVYDIRIAKAGSDFVIILEDVPTTDSDGNRLIYRLVEEAPMTVGNTVYYCLEYDDITYDQDGAFTAKFVIPGQIGHTLHNMGEPKSDDQANAVIVNYEPDPEAYTLAVIKVDFSNQNSRLQGADFKLYDENKALIAKRTSDKDGTAEFWGYITPPDNGSGWGSGVGETSGFTRTVTYTRDVKYYLEESRTPEGYLTASEKELVVTWTKVERYGKRSADSPWTLMSVVYSCTAVVDGAYASVDIDSKTISFEVANEKTAVYVSNVDVDNGWEIEGAELQIIDIKGNVVEEWTAGSDAQKIEGLKIGEEYTLHEKTAPDGYKITGDDKFTIDAAGEVTFTGSTTVDAGGNTVMLVENELTAVYVSKVDVADGEEVEGAKLQIIDSEGNVVDEWTSKKNVYEIRGLKTGEEYILHEEIAPEGYTVAADTKFSLDAEGKLTSTGSTTVDESGNTVMLVENAKTVIYVSKVDVADGIDVEGAKLQIIDSEGNVVDEWISAGTARMIEGLKTGEEYTVHEAVAPEGYTVAADTKFTLGANGKVTSTGSTSTDENGDTVLIVENAKTVVRILKTDVADGRAVEGAKLQIIDKEGNVIDEWTSNSEARVIEGLKTGVEYTIQEKVAPEGYTVTTDTTFTIDVTGKITTTGSTAVDNNGDTFMLVENAKTVVYVSKVDIDDGWEVEGATLQIIDGDGNIVEEWFSAADAHKIEGLKTGEEYTIREAVAPEGYTVTTDTTFTIDETGKITTTGSAAVDENGNTVMLVENAKTVVYISKVDIDGGWEVEGATLQIIDSEGNVVVEWTSTSSAYEIRGLKTGEEYTLHEEVAPEGYTVTTDTTFTIDETGKITTTGSTTVDESGNTVMLVENAKTVVNVLKVDDEGEVLEGAKLQIIDKEGNVVEEWISNNAVHVIEGLKTGEEYTLREAEAPENYVAADDTTFTIDETGALTSTGSIKIDEEGKTVLLVNNSLIKYTVTVNAEPSEGGTVSGGGTFVVNSSVTVTATVGDDYIFEGWYSGDSKVSDELVYTFALTQDTELTAKYREKIVYTVIWLDGDDTVLDSKTYKEGEEAPETTVKVPVKAEDDNYTYIFDHWDDGTVEGTVTTYRPFFTAVPKEVENPQTGDNMHTAMTLLVFASLACSVLALAFDRKRKGNSI